MVKHLVFAVCVVLAFGGLNAQTPAWQPSRGHTQVPIWPGAVPDSQPAAGPEVSKTTRETPPTFLLQAEDDHVDDVNHSLVYYIALKTAGVPVELHLFAHGGHAFGLRRTVLPITGWPELVEKWLSTIGMMSK